MIVWSGHRGLSHNNLVLFSHICYVSCGSFHKRKICGGTFPNTIGFGRGVDTDENEICPFDGFVDINRKVEVCLAFAPRDGLRVFVLHSSVGACAVSGSVNGSVESGFVDGWPIRIPGFDMLRFDDHDGNIDVRHESGHSRGGVFRTKYNQSISESEHGEGSLPPINPDGRQVILRMILCIGRIEFKGAFLPSCQVAKEEP